MKLILKEYLAALRERDELDAILPDLLSQLGFTVLSKPRRGTKQHGVDVAAVGSLDGEPKRLYLFSIKAGDLTRAEWNGTSAQALRPSLDEIQDSYLPTRVSVSYRDLEIVICACVGGVIREEVQSDVRGYFDRNARDGLVFEDWNGDFLAELILRAFLREELLPKDVQAHLRKAVALVEEPDAAFRHMEDLMNALLDGAGAARTRKVTALRQIYIALWVLYAWCRGADNVEAAFLASERALLLAWHAAKDQIAVNAKNAKAIVLLAQEIAFLHLRVGEHYFEEKIFPYAGNRYAVSAAVGPGDAVDVNLRLFSLLGRIALAGLWRVHLSELHGSPDDETGRELNAQIARYADMAVELINNNPVLLSPLKDDHAVDIHLAAMLFAAAGRHAFLFSWLAELVDRCAFSLSTRGAYPCIHTDYRELIRHPRSQDDEHFEGATAGSTLFPMIAVWAALFDQTALFARVAELQKEHLKHSTFQLWHPSEDTEQALYINRDNHGAALTGLDLASGAEAFLEVVFDECGANGAFNDLSSVRAGAWPILLTACRRYRLPVPMHFLLALFRQRLSDRATVGSDATEAAAQTV